MIAGRLLTFEAGARLRKLRELIVTGQKMRESLDTQEESRHRGTVELRLGEGVVDREPVQSRATSAMEFGSRIAVGADLICFFLQFSAL